VLFKFKDHTNRALPSADDIRKLMNHPGNGVTVAYDPVAPTGSVRFVPLWIFLRLLLGELLSATNKPFTSFFIESITLRVPTGS
jgi:hypothetical protein